MQKVEIVQRTHKVLRQVAEEVHIKELTSPRIQNIIANMKVALAKEHDGVALAAPQIAESVRIFVVSGRIFDEDFKKGARLDTKKSHPDVVFINPVIKKASRDKKVMEEGCLSIRYLYGKIRRASRVELEAIDEHGKEIQMKASGLLAQIFQHETDHLNGILFIDNAKDIEDMPPTQIEKTNKKIA